VITTSPIQSHPSIEVIQSVIESFAYVPGLPECEMFIVCDGVRVADQNAYKRGCVTQTTDYQHYMDRLESYCATHFPRAQVIRRPQRYGFAANVRYAIEDLVKTELVFVIQHDWQFIRRIDSQGLLELFENNSDVNYITFNSAGSEAYHLKIQSMPVWCSLSDATGLIRGPPVETGDLLLKHFHQIYKHPILPLFFFYDKNHLARTEWYRQFVFRRGHFHPTHNQWVKVKNFIEDTLGHCIVADVSVGGYERHKTYGTFIWNEDNGARFLNHVDGRTYMTSHEKDKFIRECTAAFHATRVPSPERTPSPSQDHDASALFEEPAVN
jgi:hypothetical protein